MRNNSKYIGMVLLIVLLVSCRGAKSTAKENNTVTITETIHDTVFKIEKDSSSYKALLVCQNRKVIVSNVIQAGSGHSLKSPRVRVENNKLYVDCELKEQELYAFWKYQQVNRMELKSDIEYINQLTFWRKLQIWLGRIFLVVICYYTFRFSIRFYRPFNA